MNENESGQIKVEIDWNKINEKELKGKSNLTEKQSWRKKKINL